MLNITCRCTKVGRVRWSKSVIKPPCGSIKREEEREEWNFQILYKRNFHSDFLPIYPFFPARYHPRFSRSGFLPVFNSEDRVFALTRPSRFYSTSFRVFLHCSLSRPTSLRGKHKPYTADQKFAIKV